MKTVPPLVRTEAALALIVAALVLPQLLGRAGQAAPASWTEAYGPAALEYARERIWNDFLAERAGTLPGRILPGPSMSEYRAYLAGRGLKQRGDAITYLVLPPFHPEHLMDRVQVKLSVTGEPLQLDVALLEARDRRVPVGSLHIADASAGGLQCRDRTVDHGRIWSYWPITPQPLLP